jgi:hypothetical protein
LLLTGQKTTVFWTVEWLRFQLQIISVRGG